MESAQQCILQVAVYVLKRLKAPGLVTEAEALTEDMQVVDATCSTQPDAYTAAAEAIGDDGANLCCLQQSDAVSLMTYVLCRCTSKELSPTSKC